MFDSHTIYLVGSVSQVVFALTLCLLAFSDRRTEGTRWLAAACCLELLSTSARFLLQAERAAIALSAGSCLLVLVFFFLYMGMRWFAQREPLRTPAGPLLTTFAMLAVLMISLFSVNAGLAASRFAVAIIMAMMLPMLWDTRFPALRVMTRTTAIIVLLMLVTLSFRTVQEGLITTPLSPTVETVSRYITMLLATALSFAFVGLFVAETKRRLHDETRIDVLTDMPNRRAMEETLGTAVRDSLRGGYALSLLVFDVDLFKNLNDTWGHAVGDRALQALGHLLQRTCRAGESVARLGGEEFAMLLPHARLDDAACVADSIREAVEAIRIRDEDSVTTFTVSVGVSSLQAGETGWMDMLRRADKALYRAKHEGRNRVSMWTERDGLRGSHLDSKLLHWRRPVPGTPEPQTKKRAEGQH